MVDDNKQRQQATSVENTFKTMLERENHITDVADKIASFVQEERARKKRFHELSMRDIAVAWVTEWTTMFTEALQVSGWEDFVALFNKSAERAFYLGLTLVVVSVCIGLVSMSAP